jgi:hypothetical protein
MFYIALAVSAVIAAVYFAVKHEEEDALRQQQQALRK